MNVPPQHPESSSEASGVPGAGASPVVRTVLSKITKSTGEISWGEISAEIQLATGGAVRAGPIFLFEGKHDTDARGFGRTHIVRRHNDEFISDGFEKFVTEAVTRFHEIYRQNDKLIVVLRPGKGCLKGLLAVLEYRETADMAYYSIITVYRSASDKRQHGELVWKKEKFG